MKFFRFCLLLAPLLTARPGVAQSEDRYTIVPRPARIVPRTGEFVIGRQTIVLVPGGRPDLKLIADDLVAQLNRATQFGISMRTEPYLPAAAGAVPRPVPNVIRFLPTLGGELGQEGYTLDASPTVLTLEAADPAGFFYAVQTLRQLLPPALLERMHRPGLRWAVPAGRIEDRPRFAWRGMHLDVARHFVPVAFLKKHLDLMALHKFNVFHWHLTDDQGWRIEIKKYPRLTQVGSLRPNTLLGHFNEYDPQQYDNKPVGGFYTQDDIREIVRYARNRHITIVPEIELPGHALAALAAYPEYGCAGLTTGKNRYAVATKWGVFEDVFCPYEKTFTFLQDVLTEVMALFPSTYIHIGGDECPTTAWRQSAFCQQLIRQQGLKNEAELQSYFIRRIDKFLVANGRRLLGWEEILQGSSPATRLSAGAAVMGWQGVRGGSAALRQGHDVVMSPDKFCYLNYFQAEPGQEPLAFGGYLPLATVYGYDPLPDGLTTAEARHLLGAQVNLWMEYIQTEEAIEYQLWPRAAAFAEVVWTDKTRRSYTDFCRRLPAQFERLRLLGVNAATSFYAVTMTGQPDNDGLVQVSLTADETVSSIRYTIDGGTPTADSPVYTGPFSLTRSATVRAAPFAEGRLLSRATRQEYVVSKATGKPCTLRNAPVGNRLEQARRLTDGTTGRVGGYDFAEVVTFRNTDLNAVIDLGAVQSVARVTLGVLNYTAQSYCLPRQVLVSVSENGQTFLPVGMLQTNTTGGQRQMERVVVGFVPTRARYVRVVARPLLTVPPGLRKAGQPARLGVDEIAVD